MLFEHQRTGAAWLAANPKGYLGDTPGTGKTRTAIQSLLDAGVRRPLIVCPAIVRTHWRRELAVMDMPEAAVLSYDYVVRGGMPMMAEMLTRGKTDGLVVDEAHYTKHPTSQRAQLLFGRDGYARRLEVVHPLSGTPSPRHPGELWTALSCLHPALMQQHGLRTHAEWLDRFCVTKLTFARGQMREKVIGMRNVEELRAILGRVMLRRTMADVGLDVPALWWQITRLDGDDLTVGSLEATDLDAITEVQARLLRGESLAEALEDPHIARMRRKLGELKAPAVVERVRSELAETDDKLVLFAYHRNVLTTLRECLATFGVAYIDGDTPDSRRATEIDRFQTDPKCRIFLGQNIACQTGITLTAASRVILVEPEWTNDVNVQLGHRVARIGQTAERCVGEMVALAGTIDEAIIGQCRREAQMSADTYGGIA